MKRALFFILIAVGGFYACQKPDQLQPPPSASLSGKYALYRVNDTSFIYNGTTLSSANALIETTTGDTAYLNIGTNAAMVQPNPITNFNFNSNLADTLNFTSATAGNEFGPGGT